MFPYATFVYEMERDGFKGEILVDEELGALRQQAVVSDFMSRGRLVASGVPHRSGMGPVLLNIFVSDTASGIKCRLSKFADDTELKNAADITNDQDSIQRELPSSRSELEEEPSKNLVKKNHKNLGKFIKSQCKVPHLAWANPRHEYNWENSFRAVLWRST